MEGRLFGDVADLAGRMGVLAVDRGEHAELGIHEGYASGRLQEPLADVGFEVDAGRRSYGAGDGPTIGILHEYDVLLGLPQGERSLVKPDASGDGCGRRRRYHRRRSRVPRLPGRGDAGR